MCLIPVGLLFLDYFRTHFQIIENTIVCGINNPGRNNNESVIKNWPSAITRILPSAPNYTCVIAREIGRWAPLRHFLPIRSIFAFCFVQCFAVLSMRFFLQNVYKIALDLASHSFCIKPVLSNKQSNAMFSYKMSALLLFFLEFLNKMNCEIPHERLTLSYMSTDRVAGTQQF